VTSRAASPVLAAGVERAPRLTIAWAGACLVAGPLLAAVLVDDGHGLTNAIAWGAGLQAVGVLATPGSAPRLHRWLTSLAYAGVSWLFVFVLLKAYRTSDTCDRIFSVGTLDNARLVVTAAAALAAVIVVVSIAAAARLPHAAVLVLAGAAFALAVVAVSRLDAPRLVDTWQTLGSHYLSNDSYSEVCGRRVNLET
jgi:hypothetical protein